MLLRPGALSSRRLEEREGACAGLERAPRFLALSVLLQLFGPNVRRAQVSFRSFVAATTG